ncbi:hypothetical protein GGR53DRAFT_488653 [Hypoxylon sp. FL1150]|nr:hypothetical protein GGR53DRAFT_488653 [Hypoxylon sp. FL1150]
MDVDESTEPQLGRAVFRRTNGVSATLAELLADAMDEGSPSIIAGPVGGPYTPGGRPVTRANPFPLAGSDDPFDRRYRNSGTRLPRRFRPRVFSSPQTSPIRSRPLNTAARLAGGRWLVPNRPSAGVPSDLDPRAATGPIPFPSRFPATDGTGDATLRPASPASPARPPSPTPVEYPFRPHVGRRRRRRSPVRQAPDPLNNYLNSYERMQGILFGGLDGASSPPVFQPNIDLYTRPAPAGWEPPVNFFTRPPPPPRAERPPPQRPPPNVVRSSEEPSLPRFQFPSPIDPNIFSPAALPPAVSNTPRNWIPRPQFPSPIDSDALFSAPYSAVPTGPSAPVAVTGDGANANPVAVTGDDANADPGSGSVDQAGTPGVTFAPEPVRPVDNMDVTPPGTPPGSKTPGGQRNSSMASILGRIRRLRLTRRPILLSEDEDEVEGEGEGEGEGAGEASGEARGQSSNRNFSLRRAWDSVRRRPARRASGTANVLRKRSGNSAGNPSGGPQNPQSVYWPEEFPD